MNLVKELKTLILVYLPLTKLQLLNDSGYISNNNDFGIKISFNTILTAFEQYCRLQMLSGNIGYNGQFYLPPYACMFNCIKNNNLNLFNYYLLRFIIDNTICIIMKLI